MLLESHKQALLTNKTVTGNPGGCLNLWVDFHSAPCRQMGGGDFPYGLY